MNYDFISQISKSGRLFLLFSLFIGVLHISSGQELAKADTTSEPAKLFESDEILSLRMRYSNKRIRNDTNDSTYIKTVLSYRSQDDLWHPMDVRLRARGKFRLENCYYSPLKLRIDKSVSRGTLFEGNKKIKLVLPCLNYKYMNDKLIREYLGYKLYEVVSPYHYKTRLVNIEFSEISGADIKEHELLGILLEDIKKVAKRHDGRILKRNSSDLKMASLSAVRINFFQFMIGNTDYSNAYEHNQKLIVINKNIIPVPYDFDMSGLVNPEYTTVSDTLALSINMGDMSQRKYKGLRAATQLLEQVRQEFIQNKDTMMQVVRRHRSLFRSRKEYSAAKEYLLGFFSIMESDIGFEENFKAVAKD